MVNHIVLVFTIYTILFCYLVTTDSTFDFQIMAGEVLQRDLLHILIQSTGHLLRLQEGMFPKSKFHPALFSSAHQV